MNKKEIIKQGVNLYNKHFPNDKHITQKEKETVVKFFVELFKVGQNFVTINPPGNYFVFLLGTKKTPLRHNLRGAERELLIIV